jgi:RimJ/RimL family protein N-acetyltransferase
MTPPVLHTARQTLRCLAAEELLLLAESPPALGCILAIPMADGIGPDALLRNLSSRRALLLRASPLTLPWRSLWLIIDRESGTGIGIAGFRGEPDSNGSVALGYGMAPGWRGQGRTSEAAGALLHWALAQPDCLTVTATGVRRDNLASQAVLQRIGMRCIKDDGLTQDYACGRHPNRLTPARHD